MRNQLIHRLPEDLANAQPIVLFDGECSLCSSSVKFLLRHNHSGNLRFTSLQSEIGSEIVKLTGNISIQRDSVLLLQNNRLYSSSTAALKITTYLEFPWQMLGIFIIIPRFIRDAVYGHIAKNRYSWFGRKSFCLAEDNKYQERFLT